MSKFIEDEGVAFIPGLVKISESMTVPGTIRRFGEERAKQVVIERKSNLGNNWVPVTWHQLIEEVRALARGFIAMGVKPGDCIAIMAHTSYEWTLFDFAINSQALTPSQSMKPPPHRKQNGSLKMPTFASPWLKTEECITYFPPS